jgi:hypothetical protein
VSGLSIVPRLVRVKRVEEQHARARVASQYPLDNIQEECKAKGAVLRSKKKQEVDHPPEVEAVGVSVKEQVDDAIAVGVKTGANQEFVVKAKVLDSSLPKCHIKINTIEKGLTRVKLMSTVNLMDVVHLCIIMAQYLKESGRRGFAMKWRACI